MATAPFVPDFARTVAKKIADEIEARRNEEWSQFDDSALIIVCNCLRDLFARARAAIEESLGASVNAKDFVATYGSAVTDLDAILPMVQRVVAKIQTRTLPPLTEEIVLKYQSLGKDVASLRQLLEETLAMAQMPVRPINWKRVRETEGAYARAETKPFVATGKSQAGN
jgi:hypothetical protein